MVFTGLCDQDGPEGKDSVIQPREGRSVDQPEEQQPSNQARQSLGILGGVVETGSLVV